jgi:hypothetical protein
MNLSAAFSVLSDRLWELLEWHAGVEPISDARSGRTVQVAQCDHRLARLRIHAKNRVHSRSAAAVAVSPRLVRPSDLESEAAGAPKTPERLLSLTGRSFRASLSFSLNGKHNSTGCSAQSSPPVALLSPLWQDVLTWQPPPPLFRTGSVGRASVKLATGLRRCRTWKRCLTNYLT